MVVQARFVHDDPGSDNIEIKQRILKICLTAEHHTAIKAAGTVVRTLQQFGIDEKDVKFHCRDTVSMNGAMDTTLRELGNFNHGSILCTGHLGANAGEKLLFGDRFPVLQLFWATYQKILKSDNATELFTVLLYEAPSTFSDIKWWSKFDAIEQIARLLEESEDDVLTWARQVLSNDHAPESAYKIVNLLSDPNLVWNLKIELAGYCFVGGPLRRLTYGLEGDGEHAFHTFELITEEFYTLLDDPPMPEVARRAELAMGWAATADGTAALQAAIAAHAAAVAAASAGPPNVAPPRRAPRRSVTGLTAETRARVEADEAAQRAEDQKALDAAAAAALAHKVSAQCAAPPQSVAEWLELVKAFQAPAIDYYRTRLQDPDDYGLQMKWYKAASVFHPLSLADMPIAEAKLRLDGLRGSSNFPPAAVDGLIGELSALKRAVDVFATHYSMVKIGAIVHARRTELYQARTQGKVISYNDASKTYEIEFTVIVHGAPSTLVREFIPAKRVLPEVFGVLRFFKKRRAKFPAFFAAAKVIALMQPTSAAAERVFSLLEAFFGPKGRRGRALQDLINTTLKLRYHDREV